MNLNTQLTEYLEKNDGERAKSLQEKFDKWMNELSEQMVVKVKKMMEEGTNYIILKYTEEMMPYSHKLNTSKIARKVGIDWQLMSDTDWDYDNRELHITFNFPNKV